MRQGQHNNNNNRNRNRNRNRRPSGGGGGGGGGGNHGGNNSNRVLDSNGPDVKLRGTAQTIAEKYMQLGRDAQSSGDRVMAESYFQHADHYYRLWLAAQPAGQPIQFSRRTEEEMEDDAENGDGDDDAAENPQAEGAEGASAQDAGSAPADASAGDDQQQRNQRPREDQPRDGGREKFRPRWPRRGERNFEPRDGQPQSEAPTEGAETAERQDRQERADRPERRERPPVRDAEVASGDWEAPSFLKRPVTTPAPEPVSVEAVADEAAPAPERRPRGRRPRVADEAAAPKGDVAPPTSSDD